MFPRTHDARATVPQCDLLVAIGQSHHVTGLVSINQAVAPTPLNSIDEEEPVRGVPEIKWTIHYNRDTVSYCV